MRLGDAAIAEPYPVLQMKNQQNNDCNEDFNLITLNPRQLTAIPTAF
jgi:hypothetical protein